MSDKSMDVFPNNTTTKFANDLPRGLELSSVRVWELCLRRMFIDLHFNDIPMLAHPFLYVGSVEDGLAASGRFDNAGTMTVNNYLHKLNDALQPTGGYRDLRFVSVPNRAGGTC